MTPETLIQGSEEWLQARAGSLGASKVHEAIARTRTGWGASRKNLAAELVVERLTGLPAPSFMNDAMRWGVETEPQARAAYAFFLDADVQEVGLFRHPTIAWSHASPDGLVGNDGLVEFKCPSSATHIETLLGKTVPDKYVIQCLWQMACTGREWCDFVSFDPRMPEHLRMFVNRVERDDRRIKELESAVIEFLAEVDDTLAKLTGLAEPNTLLGAA